MTKLRRLFTMTTYEDETYEGRDVCSNDDFAGHARLQSQSTDNFLALSEDVRIFSMKLCRTIVTEKVQNVEIQASKNKA